MKQMHPFLDEACEMHCSNLWYTKKIHDIRTLVDAIAAWKPKPKPAPVAVRSLRAVEAFASVTVETTTQQGEAV